MANLQPTCCALAIELVAHATSLSNHVRSSLVVDHPQHLPFLSNKSLLHFIFFYYHALIKVNFNFCYFEQTTSLYPVFKLKAYYDYCYYLKVLKVQVNTTLQGGHEESIIYLIVRAGFRINLDFKVPQDFHQSCFKLSQRKSHS